jgi:hypothetical protein
VSGVLTLNDAGTAATSIYITSSSQIPFLPNFNYVAGNVSQNGFYVDNGEISDANFEAHISSGNVENRLRMGLGYWYNGLRYSDNNGFKDLYNIDGLNGITFTPVTDGADTAAVPEPSTYALFGLGALALVVAYRRKAA